MRFISKEQVPFNKNCCYSWIFILLLFDHFSHYLQNPNKSGGKEMIGVLIR